ncbi:nmrA-family protein [Lenzites betulinus]|nr:nmrA-family protein [Lenzites betulinus]
MSIDKKLILVIGATGAQGIAVIDGLLKPAQDGTPSPYAVRALTRNTESQRAKELANRGVELFEGNTDDLDSVYRALDGVYGAFVNTDSFTLGESKEVFTGIRIFELAKQIKTVKHYVWSSLDNIIKKGDYNPMYNAEHYAGKGRVSDWMRAQESIVGEDTMSWSILTTGPYMDMLKMGMFGPLKVRPDGTHVFASPIGKGHVPMITLTDVGFWARHIFDQRAETSGQELEVASDWVGWDALVATFTRVTGKKAEYVPLSIDDWFLLFNQEDVRGPLAPGVATSWQDNFSRWWAIYRDDVVTRDFAWIRRVHPRTQTLEDWMRAEGYTGEIGMDLLKKYQDGQGQRLDRERVAAL